MSLSYWFAKDNPDKLVDLFIQNTDRELRVKIVNRLSELKGIKQLTALYQRTLDRSVAELLVKHDTSTPQILKSVLTTSSDKEVQVLALNHLKNQKEWKVIAGCLENKQLDSQVRLNIISLLLKENILSPDEICKIAISSNEATVHQIAIEKLIAIPDTGSLTKLLDADNIRMPIKTSVFNALTIIYFEDADKLKNLFGKSLDVSQRSVLVDRLLELKADFDLIHLLNHDNLEPELFSKIDNYLFEKSKTDAERLADLYLTLNNKNSAIRYVDQLCSSGALNSLIKVLNSENVPADHYIKLAQTVCSLTDDTAILSALYHQAEPGTIQDQIISRLCDINADKALVDLLGSASLSNANIRNIALYFTDSKKVKPGFLLDLFKIVTGDSVRLKIIDRLADLKAIAELRSIKVKQLQPKIIEHLISLASKDNALLVELFYEVTDNSIKKRAVDELIKNNAISNLWELKNSDFFNYIVVEYFSKIYNDKPLTMLNLCLSIQIPEGKHAIVSKATAQAILEMILLDVKKIHSLYIPVENKPLLSKLVIEKWFWVFFACETEITDFLTDELLKHGLDLRNQSCLMLAYTADPIGFFENISDIHIDEDYDRHVEQIEAKYLKLIKGASNRNDVEKLITDKDFEIRQLFDAKLFSFVIRKKKTVDLHKERIYGKCLQLERISSESIITYNYKDYINIIDDKLEEQLKGCRDVDRIMQAKAVADLEKTRVIDTNDLLYTLYNSDDTNDFSTFEKTIQLTIGKGQEIHKKAALFRIWSSSDSKWVVFLMKNLKHFKQYPDELLISISNKSSPHSSYNSVALLLSIENVITDKQLWNDVFYHNLKLIRENANKNHIVALSSLIKQFQKGNPILGALEMLQYRISRESDHISINNDNNPDSVDIQVKKETK